MERNFLQKNKEKFIVVERVKQDHAELKLLVNFRGHFSSQNAQCDVERSDSYNTK